MTLIEIPEDDLLGDWWDGSLGKGMYYQAWRVEFHSWDPHGSFELSSDLPMHAIAHTHELKMLQENDYIFDHMEIIGKLIDPYRSE